MHTTWEIFLLTIYSIYIIFAKLNNIVEMWLDNIEHNV